MDDQKKEGDIERPYFFEILSPDDKASYEQMQNYFFSSENRHNSIKTLNAIFKQIKEFCQRNDEDEWKRYLVCGICWFDNFLAVNTRQLRFLIFRSKSSINESLMRLGYSSISINEEQKSMLIEKIPLLFINKGEIRKWSIRCKKISQLNSENDKVKSIESNQNFLQNSSDSLLFDQLLQEIDDIYVNDDFDYNFGYEY